MHKDIHRTKYDFIKYIVQFHHGIPGIPKLINVSIVRSKSSNSGSAF